MIVHAAWLAMLVVFIAVWALLFLWLERRDQKALRSFLTRHSRPLDFAASELDDASATQPGAFPDRPVRLQGRPIGAAARAASNPPEHTATGDL